MDKDIFCKIINGEVAGNKIVMEEDSWIAMNDIHPSAPVHVLIIPKRHIDGILATETSDVELMGTLLLAVKKVAEKMGLKENGFRLVINQGEYGGQVVQHLHIHLLGGKKLGVKIVHDQN